MNYELLKGGDILDNYKIFEGKKYMWDGESYPDENAANENAAKYNEDGFDTRIIVNAGSHGVYTRRVVTDIVIEGEPT